MTAGEGASLFTLANLMRRYHDCRRRKRSTANALRFETRQELELLALRDALASRRYRPGRSVCFVVRRPKLREVFAADFRDRIVHHVLVHHLEPRWERVFIHDSWACRKGKGVHGAVQRLQRFMRQAGANGTRAAFALQLDVHNYFMSIDRQRLLGMLQARLNPSHATDAEALWLCRLLLSHDCAADPVVKGDPALLARVPAHKSLFGAPPGRGLPIGNLNSQFFANVYLNALDQFVKHELKCRWYLRYCDDFVLLARDRETLEHWRARIGHFLADELGLALNPRRQAIAPIADGVDFLGYIVRAQHLLVRRRVVGHLRQALRKAERRLHVREGGSEGWRFEPDMLDGLRASLASYAGHLRWAACRRLWLSLWRQHVWLHHYFEPGTPMGRLRPRAAAPDAARSVWQQYRHWCREFPGDEVWMQVGGFMERLQWPPRRLPRQGPRPTRRGLVEGVPLERWATKRRQRLGEGHTVLEVRQAADGVKGMPGAAVGRLLRRLPVRRWTGTAAG